MHRDEVENCMHASSEDFDAILAPLEQGSGQRLNGPARIFCMQAFKEYPTGVRGCAAKALRLAHSNPVGLFLKMLKDGDHRRPERSLAPDAPRTPLETMLAWAETVARQLEPDDREEIILSRSDLNEEERARVRNEVAHSLRQAEEDAA